MKLLSALCFLAAFAVLGTWLYHGQREPTYSPRAATLFQEHVKEPAKNEDGTPKTDDFGDPIIEEKWVDTFKLGLDYAGPAMGVFGFLGVGLFIVGRRRSRAVG